MEDKQPTYRFKWSNAEQIDEESAALEVALVPVEPAPPQAESGS